LEGGLSDVALRVEGLEKTFDPGLMKAKVEVLKGLSFEVERGTIFGFLGPNGAGKTTTIKAIVGLIWPDSGAIEICGWPHTTERAKKSMGFMAENPYVYPYLTGREFLEFHAELLALASDVATPRVSDVLDRVTMSSVADRHMRTYSKGMLQRMSLAQALLGEPELLILDEPMSGLDPLGRRNVRDIILSERRRGTTVFFSSHIIPDVETICDRVAIVADGRVRAVGEVRDLVAHEVEAYEVAFAGVDIEDLETRGIESHAGSDAAWVRVATERRDALIRELVEKGARIVGIAPVRSSLEDFLLEHYKGGAS
jgi:ABC-2 type transport system ATP-binding protein